LAATFTHDVEILLSQRRVSELFCQTPLSPIDYEENEQTLTARPLGPPKVFWLTSASTAPMADCMFVETSWEIDISGPSQQQIKMIQSVTVTIGSSQDAAESSVSLVETNVPRYFGVDGHPYDPFSMLPRKDGTRGRIKEAVHKKITDELGKQDIKLPKVSAPG